MKAKQYGAKTEVAVKRMISSARPHFSETDIKTIQECVARILESGTMILGPYTEKFEKEFARHVGTKHALATSSCTSALEIAMRFFDVRNREVVVPTNTFIACPNSVVFAGGNPVFADIDAQTYSSDGEKIQDKLTEKTKGVMAVHLAG